MVACVLAIHTLGAFFHDMAGRASTSRITSPMPSSEPSPGVYVI
jgi:hypothetical protein